MEERVSARCMSRIVLVGRMAVTVGAHRMRCMPNGVQLPHGCKHRLHDQGKGKQQCCVGQEWAVA